MSFFRLRRLRAFSTFLPPFVAILARNPWVLALEILLGCNVLFMIQLLGVRPAGALPGAS